MRQGRQLPESRTNHNLRTDSSQMFDEFGDFTMELLLRETGLCREAHAGPAGWCPLVSCWVEYEDENAGRDRAGDTLDRGPLDRVSALDGRLEVDSRPGQGATVRAAIPCD
jgi:hypothetical protein